MAGKALPPSGGGFDPKFKALIDKLSERVDVLSDHRGDPLDRALTPRDLLDLGLAKRIGRAAQRLVSGSNLVATTGPGSSAIPPAPTGFTVTGGLGHIFLEWDNARQAYGNHGYTAIFRNTVDNLANALEVGQTSSSFNHADLDVNYGVDYYYWIRFVSTSNIMGPPNSPVGTLGKLSEDPTELLERLSGEIGSSELAADLRTRINLIDSPITGLIDKATAEAARLTSEINQRANEVSQLANQIATEANTRAQELAAFDARLDPAELTIIAQDGRLTALESATGSSGALATALDSLDTRVGTIDQALVAQATKNTELQSAIDSKASSSALDGLQSTVTKLGNTVSSEATKLTNLSNTVGDPSTGLAATAGAVTTLTNRVSNAETNISSASDSITNLKNRADDPVTGFSALGTAVTGLNSSVSIADGKASAAASDITTINQRLNNSTTGLSAINSQLSGIDGRLDIAEGSLTAYGSDISALNQSVADAQLGLSATNDAVGALTTSVNIIGGQVNLDSQSITTINQRLDNATTGLNALNSAKDALISKVDNPVTGLTAQNDKITALTSTINNPVTGLSATAAATSGLSTQVNDGVNGLSAVGSRVTTITARLDNIGGSASSLESIANTVNHSTTGVVATSTKVSTLTSRLDNIGGSATSIEALTTAVNHSTTGLSATATKTGQLEARLNNIGGVTLEQKFTAQADSITGLYGQYTLKIDVNGRLSGWGLASTATASTFIINSDRFAIGKPGQTDSDIYPFIVDTTTGQVVIEGAFIKSATINDAQVGSIDVSKITGINASFIAANIGDLSINTLQLAGESVTTDKIKDRAVTAFVAASAYEWIGTPYGTSNPIPSGGLKILEVTISCTGNPVVIQVFTSTLFFEPGISYVALVRNTVVLASSVDGGAFSYVDNPPSGSRTYEIWIAGELSGSILYRRALLVTEFKR